MTELITDILLQLEVTANRPDLIMTDLNFFIMIEPIPVHLNGWAPRALWDEWELGGSVDHWDLIWSNSDPKLKVQSTEIRWMYFIMFLARIRLNFIYQSIKIIN